MSLCLCNRIYTIKSLEPVIVEGKFVLKNSSYLSKRSHLQSSQKQLRIWNKKVLLLVCLCIFKWKQIIYIYSYIPHVHTIGCPEGCSRGRTELGLDSFWIFFLGEEPHSGPFFFIYWQIFTQKKSIISRISIFFNSKNIFLDFGFARGEGRENLTQAHFFNWLTIFAPCPKKAT